MINGWEISHGFLPWNIIWSKKLRLQRHKYNRSRFVFAFGRFMFNNIQRRE